jgi:adenine-specific DNA methylase
MSQYKKLIEVAMPIKEVSAESVRDKSIRHGHISTLHLWWARRPLPVCRAVVFASLVPDPLDPNCPLAFREAVDYLLGPNTNPTDPYKPYDDIPFTSAIDPMADNARNRLLMFIGKFSDRYIQDQKTGRKTSSGNMLSAQSLIKWESKNNETILNKARKLIWVAHNAEKTSQSLTNLLADFDQYYTAIKTAECTLYTTPNRHEPYADVTAKETALQASIDAFLDRMPRVFDPFAGGGAIPLEAARLGCRSFGNDINPVAHIIQKGSLEFPQRFGKPITYSRDEFVRLYGEAEFQTQQTLQPQLFNEGESTITLPNRLSFDVAFYAKKLLKLAEDEIGHLYPAGPNGKRPIAYYWARVGTCSNPSCQAEVPLLKQFHLCNKPDKAVYLKPIISGTTIEFEIKTGAFKADPWITRGNMVCPCCGNTTTNLTLKVQFVNKQSRDRMLAVIEDGPNGKSYRLPTQYEIEVAKVKVDELQRPTESLPVDYTKAMAFCLWGFSVWGDMFSSRQLVAIQTLTRKIQDLKGEIKSIESEYGKAIVTYLGMMLDRIAAAGTSFGRWHTGGEKLEHPFSRQAIAMVFDYPESNLFSGSTGSGSNQIDWLVRYIESEGCSFNLVNCNNASSGDKEQFPEKYLTTVVTDPPYYDAIAYADLSDFFYVWLKRSIGDLYPLNFMTPQTPKTEECTALKHNQGSVPKAKAHFENKLQQIFDAIEHQTTGVVSIMFAHQSTEAWTTLCNSILGAGLNITGSWSVDSEMANRSVGLAGAALESSVTVSCRPSQRQGYGEYREVRKAIEATVAKEVDELYRLGFRGADLLTACFGQAVSEFGQYERVEKADGSEVTVAELLVLARDSAFNALLKGFDGDDYTKFYIGWLQLYDFTESDFDDVNRLVKIGLAIETKALFDAHLLRKNGNKQTLAGYNDRLEANRRLGQDAGGFLIDDVHRAMYLYASGIRSSLLMHIARAANTPEHPFWRVLNALLEVLPAGCDDHQQATGLLTNKDSLIRESREPIRQVAPQLDLGF